MLSKVTEMKFLTSQSEIVNVWVPKSFLSSWETWDLQHGIWQIALAGKIMATFLCLWGEEADLWVWQQQQAEEGKWEAQTHNHTSSLQLSSSPKMEKMSNKRNFLFDESVEYFWKFWGQKGSKMSKSTKNTLSPHFYKSDLAWRRKLKAVSHPNL